MGANYFHIFLEAIEALPNLYTDECIVIEDEIRASFKQFVLKDLQPKILRILHMSLGESIAIDEKMKYKLLKCFKEWLLDETDMSILKDMHQHNLVLLAFSELKTAD